MATASLPANMGEPPVSNPDNACRPRKRNVISRDRNGCFTCRKRHLRCDKSKPHCKNCAGGNLACEGYGNKISFRDQTFAVTQKALNKQEGSRKRLSQELTRGTSEPQLQTHSEQAVLPQESADLFASPSADFGFLDSSSLVASETIGMGWDDWTLSELLRFDSQQLIPYGDSPSSLSNTDNSTQGDTFPDRMQAEIDDTQMMLAPLSASLSTYAHSIQYSFQFDEDFEYHVRLREGKVQGFTTILPLQELIGDEALSTPYLHSAALAISALTLSAEGNQSSVTQQQALQHYTKAFQALHESHAGSTVETFKQISLENLLSWFFTRLLLASFDVRLGALAAWRAHLRIAGSVLSACHRRFVSSRTGVKLVQAYARMALLVEMQNEDFAVTRTRNMNPGVASELFSIMQRSESPRDRLLVLIRQLSKTETKFKYRPALAEKWVMKMDAIDLQLSVWQKKLPSSELPVDTGVAKPVAFACSTLEVTPLTFPNSEDPYVAAVNYAHFLCARMRARTRYLEQAGRVTPQDTEITVLNICRIAAGVAPSGCAQADAFGHGMMPAIVGANRWTTDVRVRDWIAGWLRGYEQQGPREGIWNVCQTRRLLNFLDAEAAKRRNTKREWDIVAAKIEEEDDLLDEDGKIWDKVMRRGSAMVSEVASQDGLSGYTYSIDDPAPFKIVLHSRISQGWSTDYIIIP